MFILTPIYRKKEQENTDAGDIPVWPQCFFQKQELKDLIRQDLCSKLSPLHSFFLCF